MLQENVEIVRALFATWNAGDMDAHRELHDPTVIVRSPEGWPEPGPFVGREAVMHQWEQQRETWDADVVEPTSDFIDVADRVAVRFIWRGTGHGPASNVELTAVYTVRKGLIFYEEFFWDHAEALETLGLSEQAMSSQENVEIVRQAFRAFADGGVEAALASFAPDLALYVFPEWPGPSEYRGHDGLRALMAEWTENFDEFEMEVHEVREVGDRVLVLAETVGRIKGSGLPIRQPFGAVYWDFRDGRIGETRNFLTWREALEAAGLKE
ncbi:MAG: nuclear transport factor 2 family protein [Solirubrobacterales bacterium]